MQHVHTVMDNKQARMLKLEALHLQSLSKMAVQLWHADPKRLSSLCSTLRRSDSSHLSSFLIARSSFTLTRSQFCDYSLNSKDEAVAWDHCSSISVEKWHLVRLCHMSLFLAQSAKTTVLCKMVIEGVRDLFLWDIHLKTQYVTLGPG